MGQFFILRSRVQQEYNSLLVNALNRIFKSNQSLNNFKWLLTKLELSRVRYIIPRSRKRLWNGYPVLTQELQNHDPVGRHIMYGSTPPGATQTPMYIYACLMRDVHRSLVGDESIYSNAAALFENSITTKRIMRLVLEVNITTFFSYNSTYWWWKSIIFPIERLSCNRVIWTWSFYFENLQPAHPWP